MKLIFVYNANSGKLNTLFDIAHKLISPESYQCDLCSLTHGALSEKHSWREFREKTHIEMEFLHKNEFEQQHAAADHYPAIFRKSDRINPFLSNDEISRLKSIDELIALIEQRASVHHTG